MGTSASAELPMTGDPVLREAQHAETHAEPSDEEARILVDVDLSILGETDDVYSRYEQQVRREHKWVPSDVFWAHRTTILKRFMDREWIYFTDPLRRSEYEARARKNLGGSVAS